MCKKDALKTILLSIHLDLDLGKCWLYIECCQLWLLYFSKSITPVRGRSNSALLCMWDTHFVWCCSNKVTTSALLTVVSHIVPDTARQFCQLWERWCATVLASAWPDEVVSRLLLDSIPSSWCWDPAIQTYKIEQMRNHAWYALGMTEKKPWEYNTLCLKVYDPITFGFIHWNGVIGIRWKPLFFSLPQ